MDDAWPGPYSGHSAATHPPLTRAVSSLMAHRDEVGEDLVTVWKADAQLPLAHLIAAFLALREGRRSTDTAAREHLTIAADALRSRGGSEREWSFHEALSDWLAGQKLRAASRLDALQGAAGSGAVDSLAAKFAQQCHTFAGGGAAMLRSAEAAVAASAASHPAHAYHLGALAFALQECGAGERAQALGLEALAGAPDSVLALTAVAQAQHATRAFAGCRQWLLTLACRPESHPAFVRTSHWNAALCSLSLGLPGDALLHYDRAMKGRFPSDPEEYANAVLVLWHLKRCRIPLAERWDPLLALARQRIGDHRLALADLFPLLVLITCAAPTEAADCLHAMDTAARAHPNCEDARTLAEVGLPLGRALLLRGLGHPERAARLMRSTQSDWPRLGGTRVQRELFAQILEEAIHAAQGGPARPTTQLRPVRVASATNAETPQG